MSLRSDALCEVDDIINHDKLVKEDGIDNKLVEKMINNVTAAFNIEVGVDQFLTNAFTDERFDGGAGGSKFFMPRRFQPLQSITSLYDDTGWAFAAGSLIAASSYVIVDGRYIQLLNLVFVNGSQNIKMSGTRGYAAGSDTLLALNRQCIIEVVRSFNRRGKEDISGFTDPHGNTSYIKRGWTDDTIELLNSLKIKGLY